MNFALNVPINPVSFGQVSTLILRELYKRKINPCIFPIGDVDLGTQEEDKDFFKWISSNINKSLKEHKRTDPIFKLWHLNDSIESYSEKQVLLSFHELDKATEEEVNIARNNAKVLFSSHHTVDVFKDAGCDNVGFLPLAFDNHNFKKLDKKYYNDDRISFLVVGKYEKRKGHSNILEAWVKKYGDNKDFFLSCAVYNPFFKPEDNNKIIAAALQGKKYFNVQFLGFMPKNSLYNDFLNSGDVIIGMSGGEGWALPEFHATALGAHSVILNAHAHKEWADEANSVLVEPSGKIPAEDGLFFKPDGPFNQGNIFDFDQDAFIDGCERAIERVRANRVNEAGLTLQEKFTAEDMVDKILKTVESL
jgi:glycosyltransferase involved in cell wall biosynthesis